MRGMRFWLVAMCALPLAAQVISGERIRAHVKFLASDLLEGRGVGVRGGDLTTEYLAAQFALAGAKPAGDKGTYFQAVPLVGLETQAGAKMSAAAGGKSAEFEWLTDFVGIDRRQVEAGDWEAELVFVGHGITAPEFKWDDYKGADVKGKVVVLFTNEPPSEDAKFFGGRALTYYGRWTYKFEEALRHGARGAIIVHTTPTASYGWEVVRNSWGREDPYVKLAAGAGELAWAGWVTEKAGNDLFALSGRTVAEMLSAADAPGFKAAPLNATAKVSTRTKIRDIATRNVAAMALGSDPSGETVIFSAHWDHLGIGMAVAGDRIYNGAVDNATGCGMLLEIARAWAQLEPRPRRSALFLAVTAEEGGLRGSEFYAGHPLIATGKTAVAINFDALQPFGRTKDVVIGGLERTTLAGMVEGIAQRFQLSIKPDPRPEAGLFYRSDHFSFAKAGVPSFSIKNGTDFAGKPADFGMKALAEYTAKNYHQPSDDYRDEWDFAGLAEIAHFGMVIGMDAANMAKLPTWVDADEFKPARDRSLRGR